jgi:hypothetical protein
MNTIQSDLQISSRVRRNIMGVCGFGCKAVVRQVKNDFRPEFENMDDHFIQLYLGLDE